MRTETKITFRQDEWDRLLNLAASCEVKNGADKEANQQLQKEIRDARELLSSVTSITVEKKA